MKIAASWQKKKIMKQALSPMNRRSRSHETLFYLCGIGPGSQSLLPSTPTRFRGSLAPIGGEGQGEGATEVTRLTSFPRKRHITQYTLLCCLSALLLLASTSALAQDVTPLPGTELLQRSGDLSAQMVAGIDRFLTAELERSI